MKDEVATTIRPVTLHFAVTLKSLVYFEPEARGYSTEVPALPGCYTQGDTLEEVRANLREAVEGWVEAAHDELT